LEPSFVNQKVLKIRPKIILSLCPTSLPAYLNPFLSNPILGKPKPFGEPWKKLRPPVLKAFLGQPQLKLRKAQLRGPWNPKK